MHFQPQPQAVMKLERHAQHKRVKDHNHWDAASKDLIHAGIRLSERHKQQDLANPGPQM